MQWSVRYAYPSTTCTTQPMYHTASKYTFKSTWPSNMFARQIFWISVCNNSSHLRHYAQSCNSWTVRFYDTNNRFVCWKKTEIDSLRHRPFHYFGAWKSVARRSWTTQNSLIFWKCERVGRAGKRTCVCRIYINSGREKYCRNIKCCYCFYCCCCNCCSTTYPFTICEPQNPSIDKL